MTRRKASLLTIGATLAWLGVTTRHLAGGGVVTSSTPDGVTSQAGVAAASLPIRLSQTGLYRDVERLIVDERNRAFSPQYPLWSDGAAKRRWIRLPEGTVIDTTDVDRWDFPVGTRLWKEFAFGGRRVETRLLLKTHTDRWAFASYAWSEDQRDATLAPAEGIARAAEVAPGKWHAIPSVIECRSCHDSGRTEVLGFTALQLSTDRDPLAPHGEPLTPDMMTLDTLVRERRVRPALDALVRTPPRIEARDARERAVLGYLSTNCGACHNRDSETASVGLFLKYTLRQRPGACAPEAIASSFNRPGHWLVSSAPDGTSRVVAPGLPDRSALWTRMKSRRPSSQMPPIGTVLPDQGAIELTRTWIASAVNRHDGADCSSRPPTQ